MKKSFVIILIIFSALFFAQKKKSVFIPVEITKEDGTVLNVLMDGIYFPKSERFEGMIAQSGTKHSIYSTKVNFEYKTSESAEIQTISFNDLQKIKIKDKFDDEFLGYEKLKLMEFDKKMNVVHKNYIVIVPILYDGKMNLYGYDSYTCLNSYQCSYDATLVYIKKKGDPYAFVPYDLDRSNVFNIGSTDDRFIEAYRKAGKDCPYFLQYLDELQAKMNAKGYFKKYLSDYFQHMKIVRAKIDELNLIGEEKKNAINRGKHDFYMKYYLGVLMEYEKNCP